MAESLLAALRMLFYLAEEDEDLFILFRILILFLESWTRRFWNALFMAVLVVIGQANAFY